MRKMLSLLPVLLAGLIFSGEASALNPYPIAVEVSPNPVYDMMDFNVHFEYVDGVRGFNDMEESIEPDQLFSHYVFGIFDDNENTIVSMNLSKVDPLVALSDDEKSLDVRVPIREEIDNENGFDLPPGTYKVRIYDFGGPLISELIAEKGFSVVAPPSPDLIVLRHEMLLQGMNLYFSLISTEENVEKVPLPYIYEGVDLSGRDYLGEHGWDVGIYDLDGNLVKSYVDGDFVWNKDGSYRVPIQSEEASVVKLTRDGEVVFSQGFWVEKDSLMDLLLINEKLNIGDLMTFKILYRREQSFNLPILISELVSAVWEASTPPEAFYFVVRDDLTDDQVVNELMISGGEGLSEIEDEKGNYVEKTRVVDFPEGTYRAEVVYVDGIDSYVIGSERFNVIAIDNTCAGFSDVSKDSKYCEAITWAKDNGVIDGYPDGTFGADMDINRVEMLKVVLEALNLGLNEYDEEADGLLGFKDLYSDQWYMPYIKTGQQLGVFVGDEGKETARPNSTVNRVEALKITFESVVIAGGEEFEKCDDTVFLDVDVDEWYLSYVCAAEEYGLFDLENDDEIEPAKLSTRGEVVLLLFRLNKVGVFVGNSDE